MDYLEEYINETIFTARNLDKKKIQTIVDILILLKERNGRLFFVGSGGSAGTASHAVNDFRKIVGIETYTPTDNVSELTARINDDGWETSYSNWLVASNINKNDCLFVLSVGGGDEEKNISVNLIEAIKTATKAKADIVGIVGRDGGYTARAADAALIIPVAEPKRVTPHAEAFQSVVLHMLVSHPSLQKNVAKWESQK